MRCFIFNAFVFIFYSFNMCVWCIDSPGNCRHERCGEGVGVTSVHEYIKKKASTVIILDFNLCLRLVKVKEVHVTS